MSKQGWPLKVILFRGLVGLAITTALILFLLRYVDLDQIGQLLAGTNWLLWWTGFGLWILVYLVRMMRFKLLAPRTPYLTMLCITSIHNFLLRLLPMRMGDVSYAFLVKRDGTAGLGESLLGLLLLRILDATSVVFIFSINLAIYKGLYLGDKLLGVITASAAVILGILLVIYLRYLLRLGLRMAKGTALMLGIAKRPRIEASLNKICDAIKVFDKVGPWVVAKISAASIVIWLLLFSAFFIIMRGFSIPVGAAQTVLGSTAAVVTGFLPVGGIGSFGTLETGWALGFVLVGLSKDKAVASAFGVSLTTFAYAAILGFAGWILLVIINKRNNSVSNLDTNRIDGRDRRRAVLGRPKGV